jgi:uncharacterized protein
MRLSPDQVSIIRQTVAEVAGPDAIVRLFGSRLHDELVGGDIDLHIEVGPERIGQTGALDLTLWSRLAMALRTELIDLVWSVRGQKPHAIEAIAYREGLVL